MIWDMDCIEWALMSQQWTPHLVDPGFDVLAKVLAECRTSTCQVNPLHGLGHLHDGYPERTEQLIGTFLKRRDIARWVRDYAQVASAGEVM
jgi:hypothetical protein